MGQASSQRRNGVREFLFDTKRSMKVSKKSDATHSEYLCKSWTQSRPILV